MKKRTFVKISGLCAAGAAMSPLISSCKMDNKSTPTDHSPTDIDAPFSLPPLSYGFDELEPHIDAQTMRIHHGKHHAGYVRKLNAAVADLESVGELEGVITNISADETAIRNNGGGHFNHSLFWAIMSPAGGDVPSGDFGDAINAEFGDFNNFKNVFHLAAMTRFGSGWAWLNQDTQGKLFVSTTANQDNPLMKNIVEKTGTPLLGIDVWEHAYYLHYQNRRGDYIKSFFNLIDWNAVAARFKV